MTDPTRLVDEGGTGLGARLLRAASEDPASESVTRALALARALDAHPPAVTSTGGWRSGVKWTWAGLVGLGIVVSGAAVLTSRTSAPVATRLPSELRASTSRVDDAPWVQVPGGPTEVEAVGLGTPSAVPEGRKVPTAPLGPHVAASVVASQQSVAVPPVARSPEDVPSASRRAGAAEDDSFAAELHAIDDARRAISLGNYANGLALLDTWAVSFPRRRFDEEASVLRMEALRGAGDHERSLELARDFLLAHPSSPLAQRVRSLMRPDP